MPTMDFVKALILLTGIVFSAIAGYWELSGQAAAERFVNRTVNDHISRLEEKQDVILEEQARIRGLIQELQDARQNRDVEIEEMLRILRGLEGVSRERNR